MPTKSVTSLELRKLIVKLRNEDKLSIGNILKTVGKSKSVIHSILRKLEETGSCEAKKLPSTPRKTTARENRWIRNESKKDRFATATAISKRANANFGVKISKHTISRRLNEINLNSRVAFTKPYISKKNKINQLKFATEHVIWTEEQWGCVHFSDESKLNLFGWDKRRFIRRSPKERYSLKSALNFKMKVWWCLAWNSAANTGPLVRLHGKIKATVCKEILKKHVCT